MEQKHGTDVSTSLPLSLLSHKTHTLSPFFSDILFSFKSFFTVEFAKTKKKLKIKIGAKEIGVLKTLLK